MDEIYVWEFWFSNKPENKKTWYIKKVNWEYKLIISESFENKKIQSFVSWKTVFAKNNEWIINWKIINENEIISWYKYVSLIWLSNFDNWTDIKEYYFKYLIFWFHFLKYDDIFFKNFEFSFNWLSKFIWKWNFEIINSKPKEFNIFLKDELIIKIWEYEWFELVFINRLNQKIHNENFSLRGKSYQILNSFSLNNNYFLNISSIKSKITLDKIETFIINFQRFFSLIFMRDIKIENISIKKDIFYSKKQKDFMKIEKDFYTSDIEIIFNQWFISENNVKRYILNSNNKMLFNLPELNNLWGLISNFFVNLNKFKTIYNLYYTTIQNENLHLENQFLNLIQAIEWMYLKSNTLIEIFWKEKSLVNKLKQIEKYLWVAFEINWKNVKNDIKNIRNCFSHWWDREDVVNLELYRITTLLRIVLEIFIIKELWLEKKLFDDIVRYKIDIELKLDIW